MSDLVIVAFDDEQTAFDARAALVKLQREYLIEMEDAVVITRKADGGVQLHQAVNLTAIGAAGGGFWGALVGLLFLNPILGAAVGAGAGALSGWMGDVGIEDAFLKEVGNSVPPGGAALGVLIRKMTADKVLAAMGEFAGKGRVLQTSLTTDQERALADKLATAPNNTGPNQTGPNQTGPNQTGPNQTGSTQPTAEPNATIANHGEGHGAITTSAPPAPTAGSETGGEGSPVPQQTGGAFSFATDGVPDHDAAGNNKPGS